MNYFQAEELAKQMNPGKIVNLSFDQKCRRVCEIIITDGLANNIHHIENNKVRVDVEGMDPIYLPIQPHRENCTHEEMMKIISSL